MVDNMNPNSQFHPYQPETSTPAIEKPVTGLGSVLERFGLNTSSFGNLGGSLKNIDMKGSVEKARGYARTNPGLVLGGLAATVIGLGMMQRRGRTS